MDLDRKQSDSIVVFDERGATSISWRFFVFQDRFHSLHPGVCFYARETMSRTTGGDGYVRVCYFKPPVHIPVAWRTLVRPPVHVPMAWCTLCEASSTCTGGLVYFV